MKLRNLSMLAVLSALIVGVLTAMPAEAAGRYYAFLKTTNVAISSSGTGKMAVACHGRHTCKGKISFADDGGSPRVRAYKISAGRSAYVSVAMHTNNPNNPHLAPAVAGRDYRSVPNVQVKVNEDFPKNITHTYNKITTETRLARQDITGTVTARGVPATKIRVDLIRTIKGGNSEIVKGADVANGGNYTFGVNLGTNNSPSSTYRLRISGIDQKDQRRSWWWRGGDNYPAGGGAYIRDASTLTAKKTNNFDADFTYGSISGTTTARSEVTVVSPPPSYNGGTSTLRELDFQRCGNVFGQTQAASNGSYAVNFLPITATTSNRYMLKAQSGSTTAWYGKTSERFGSCYDATNYAYSRTNLITLTAPRPGKTLLVGQTNNKVKVNGVFSGAYKPTQQGDRWIRLRERVPSTAILDAPVVAEGLADGSGNREFRDLPAGNYWVEVGRRTGCSDWYGSRFPNNRLYFKGLDRLFENWKSFTRVSSLRGGSNSGLEGLARHASPNPATSAQDRIPRGYRGWSYRGYCKAYGAGTINTMTIKGVSAEFTKTTSRNPRGAVVKGHVSRIGGRTNKEMMVRLSSSSGTRVLRTDVTDGGGNFYIAGLPSGRWTVSVNSDSWRGIGRTFTGRHSITVRAGHGYNLGTLRFRH